MKDFYNFVSPFLTQVGPMATLAVLILIILSFFYRRQIGELILWFPTLFRGKTRHRDYLLLSSHDIFNVIDDVHSRIRYYEFPSDPVKTKIFHSFIHIMLEETRKEFNIMLIEINKLALIHRAKKERFTRDELKSIIMSHLGIIIQNYTNKGESELLRMGISYKDAQYVVNLFEEWRAETRDSVNLRINAIFASSFYEGNYERTLAVYELVSVSIALIPKDGIRSFETMNGYFKNMQLG